MNTTTDAPQPTSPNGAPQGTRTSLLPAAALVRMLAIARVVLMCMSFGMAVSTAVLLVIGIATLGSGGGHSPLSAVPVVAGMMGLALGAAFLGVPAMERRMVAEARRGAGPDMVLPLLELGMLFPTGRRQRVLQEQLARSLEAVDAGWWQSNARRMKQVVGDALEAVRQPSFVRRGDGPWLPALLDAIARCRRTELRRPVERLAGPRKAGALSPESLEAVLRCAEALREQERRAQMAATLLRPAEPPGRETLLRPAQAGPAVSSEKLLRVPADDPTAAGTDRVVEAPEAAHEDAAEEQVQARRV